MPYLVRGTFRGRRVEVAWGFGDVTGDPDVVTALQLAATGDPIALLPEGPSYPAGFETAESAFAMIATVVDDPEVVEADPPGDAPSFPEGDVPEGVYGVDWVN
jgi:hypothetical protein